MNDRLSAALAAIDELVGADADESQRLIGAKCKALMVGYDARWADAGYTAIAVETVLQAPLTNPDTKRDSQTFRIAGKLDVIARYNGRRVLIDHKTTSSDISDPDSSYWRQLVVEGQVNHYYLLAWMNGERFDNALWDCIRKPTISPKKLSKAERASVVADGTYYGRDVDRDYRLALSINEERESIEMYSFRLMHDCTVERPDFYFQRRAVPRIDAELLDYARELWEHGQEMLATRRRMNDTNRLPPRNSGACLQYNTPCPYLGVCSLHDSIGSAHWQHRAEVHEELDGKVGDGRDVLTNSRVRCYQTCRRREYYRFQLGVEKVDEEEKESLWFGRLLHHGIEKWWLTFLENDDGNCDIGSPVNAVGAASSSASQAAIAG